MGTVKRLHLPILICLLSLLTATCASKTANLYEGTELSPAYSKVFERNSRSKGVYSGVDTRFMARATLFSQEFTRSLISEYYTIYYLDEERKAKMLNFIEGESKGNVRFVLALYTANDRVNDVTDEDSVWSIYLVTGKEEKIKPSSVTDLDMSEEEIIRFFPYGTYSWYRFYDIRFPVEGGKGVEDVGKPYLKLVLSSPMGRAVLIYTP